ncbi:AraC family transcriptional regulator ligand-binding domain-containing protein [Xanthobacter autotrophicus]|uniref:AraC family transcriptional regulator ligand-binding domain-containing protein n=1 Tax=Xanthobacter autotrophicus TaxID=280 RepID=UPI00372C4AC4
MNRAPLQRVAGLSGVPVLLRELGADPDEACAGLSFRPEDLLPDAVIPFGEALQLLANCQRVSGQEHFGLMLGARYDHLSLGPIGPLMQASPTLGEAIRSYTQVQIGLSRGATVYSYPVGEDVILGYGIYARHQPGTRQAYDFAMAVGLNIIRSLTGNKANIAEVLICHRPPNDAILFETILKAKVRFNQYQSCVVFARADLKLANPHADKGRYDVLSAQLAAMMRIDAADPAAMLLHRINLRKEHAPIGLRCNPIGACSCGPIRLNPTAAEN